MITAEDASMRSNDGKTLRRKHLLKAVEQIVIDRAGTGYSTASIKHAESDKDFINNVLTNAGYKCINTYGTVELTTTFCWGE